MDQALFDLELTNGAPESVRRLETRFLAGNAEGVYGLTYRWNDRQTDATLVSEDCLEESFAVYDGDTVRTQTWHDPSRSECLTCHTPVSGHALAFNTLQLNRDRDYEKTTTHQNTGVAADAGGQAVVADTDVAPGTITTRFYRVVWP